MNEMKTKKSSTRGKKTECFPEVLLSTPVRNRQAVLPRFLKGIENLDFQKELLGIYFLVNDSTDASLSLLEDFKRKREKEYRFIEIEIFNLGTPPDLRSRTLPASLWQFWKGRADIYKALRFLWNKALERFAKDSAQYFFGVDSDTELRPRALKALLKERKDVITTVQFVDYGKGKILGICSDLGERFKREKLEKSKSPQLAQFIGGAFLFSRKVIEKGLSFPEDLRGGEHVAFGRVLRKAGLRIWAHPDITLAKHLMKDNWPDYPELRDKAEAVI
jgi:hypothetical protein